MRTVGARLARNANAAYLGPASFERGSERSPEIAPRVDKAKAVGAQQAHSGSSGRAYDARLHGLSFDAHFGKARTEHDGARRAARSQLRDGIGNQVGLYRHNRDIRRFGQICHAAEGHQPLHRRAVWIDRKDAPLE